VSWPRPGLLEAKTTEFCHWAVLEDDDGPREPKPASVELAWLAERIAAGLVLLGKLSPNFLDLLLNSVKFGASSELAPNMFGASSELASVMEFGREPASSC